MIRFLAYRALGYLVLWPLACYLTVRVIESTV